ncbi:MAG: hypothetical protein ACOX53_00355 [Limnochordia bacterium]
MKAWRRCLLLWLCCGVLLLTGCGGGGGKAWIEATVKLNGMEYEFDHGPMEVVVTQLGSTGPMTISKNPFVIYDLEATEASVEVTIYFQNGYSYGKITRTLRPGKNVFTFDLEG